MAVIYLRIEGSGYKYGKYILSNDILIKYDNTSTLHRIESVIKEIEIPSKIRIKYNIEGILLQYLLRELICCKTYRKGFVRYHTPADIEINRILFNLQNTSIQIIDYKWNEIINYSVREKCELEHALSWLSTLGGAFSALGDFFPNFALVAGKISYHQLMLAIRMGDPYIASRCKLYFSLSMIQRRKFKLAKRIIENEYKFAKNAVIVDTRLVKMCLGIWSKLRYEFEVLREARKFQRLQLR